ncbi:lytic murein transglycosylase [Shewanella sp.]|jgi:membrane-bound lytic murein transglycosylase B|uniref:lytic murein transglycosylase n=1 Tax=Shewanella sp. TaxID=50422 RepID=UPI003D1313E4
MGRIGHLCSWLMISLCAVAHANTADFPAFLKKLQQQARDAGIDEATMSAQFPQIKLFRRAAAPSSDKERSLERYLPSEATEQRAQAAKTLYRAHKREFDALALKYQVQPRFVLAFWGISSDYGERETAYSALSVMASLAFESGQTPPDLSAFFAALKRIEQHKNTAAELLSDSNGLLGQPRLTVSAYDRCGTDGDGDGKADIWGNALDVFATIAHCLNSQGWDDSQTWGRQVRATSKLKSALIGEQHRASFVQWQAAGVRRYDGAALPQRKDMQVSLIMPDGVNGRQYLIYDNYRALKQFLHDDYKVLALVHLSEKIKALQID